MGDFTIRSVRIHDNGDNVFNPDQDSIFNLDGSPVQESSSDTQVFLDELGLRSLEDIRGKNLPDLSRYQHFIAMGGRHLERNEFYDAASNFLSAAELGAQMHLPAGEMFRQLVNLFEQKKVQSTFQQIQSIRHGQRYTFASMFLGVQLLREMPENSSYIPRHLWNEEIKEELFRFFHHELMSMLHGELAVLENNPHGLPQVERLWDVCRDLVEITQTHFPEVEANVFMSRIESERRRLIPLGVASAVHQANEMLRDPWTHEDNFNWIRQRLDHYRSAGERVMEDPRDGWWRISPFWTQIEGLQSQVSQKVSSAANTHASSFTRITNPDEAGSAYTGTVWYLRQIHAPSFSSGGNPADPVVRNIAAHRLEVFREIRNVHLRIGTQNTLHIFMEGLPYNPDTLMNMSVWLISRRIQSAFPQGMPRGPLNDVQTSLLYEYGPAFIYDRLYPNVEIHGTEAVSLGEVPNYSRIPGFVMNFRENNGTYPPTRFLTENPGQEIVLQWGTAHRFWDEFERFYHGSNFPMPQMRSVCWGSQEFDSIEGAQCPAFSE